MTDDVQTNPVGHPSQYREEYCQQVIDLGRQGKSFVEIADELDVSPKTLRNWRNRYPEFAAAMENAKRSDQAYWERLLRDIATGKSKGNVQATVKSLQCRFKQDWTERQEITGSDGGPVEKVTRIELVGRELPEDHPALVEDRRRAANMIDIQANRTDGPAAPAILDDGCSGKNESFSNLGDALEPESLRSSAELLALFDAGGGDDLTDSEEKLLFKAIRKRTKQREQSAIQEEEERKARQAQQRLMLPSGIGGRRKWVR